MIANEIRALVDLIGIENIKTLGVAAIVYHAIALVIVLLVLIMILRGFFTIGKRVKRNRH